MPISKINEISIRSKLLSAAKKRQYIGLARNAANTRFVFALKDLLEKFDNHTVTKELNPENIDKEGSELVDHGNLFSFIGFYADSNPTKDLRDYLEEHIQLSDEAKITDNGRNKINYKFKVTVPSITQINNEEQFQTPDGWRSTSWIDLIENGVSNAVYYVYAGGEDNAREFEAAGSRSGWGLQNKKKRAEGGSFTPMKYVSELLDEFRKDFE